MGVNAGFLIFMSANSFTRLQAVVEDFLMRDVPGFRRREIR
jgi:hypothetical protein